MLLLNLNKDKILEGETITAEFIINDKYNQQFYKNKYFVLNIKQNGSNNSQQISPLYYSGKPLVWEINPLIYKFTGTYFIYITLLNDSSLNKKLANNTFIVEPDCVINNINTCNNINSHINNIQTKKEISQSFYKEDLSTYQPSIQKANDPNNIINVKNDTKIYNNDLSNKVEINNLYNNKVQKPNTNVPFTITKCDNF